MPAAAGGRPPIDLSVDQREIVDLARAMKAESDGKELRKQLLREMKAATTPLVASLKSEIQSAPSQGLPHQEGGQLRQQISKGIKPQVRLSGKSTGVSIRARTTPNVRGFRFAARRFNRESFRHKVFGREVWVEQRGHPRWFDDTTKDRREEIARAVKQSVEEMAERVAARVRSRT